MALTPWTDKATAKSDVDAKIRNQTGAGTITPNAHSDALYSAIDEMFDNRLNNAGDVPLTANWDVGAFSIQATQFISDIATGTAPFVVSSTTVVTNLKADTVVTNADLTGHVTSTGNATVLGSFTVAQLNAAISDAVVAQTVGTPADNQIAVWTGDGTVEGQAGATLVSGNQLSLGGEGSIAIGGLTVIDETSGVVTLQQVDALDGTTKATINAAVQEPIIRNVTTQTLYTPSADTDAARFTALQDAFTAAADGDRIKSININAATGTSTLTIAKGVKWVASNTKITRTDSSNTVVSVTSGAASKTVEIIGLEIDGGDDEAGSSGWAGDGDGLFVDPQVAKCVVKDCNFHDMPSSGTQAYNADIQAREIVIENLSTPNPAYNCLRLGGHRVSVDGWVADIQKSHSRQLRHIGIVAGKDHTGTATAGTVSSLTLAAGASATDGDYVGMQVGITDAGIPVDAQDETRYDNSPSTEGTFAGGTGHAVSDVITLTDGTTATVDAESSGVVTEFTISNSGTTTRSADGATISQSSTTGSGTGFSITLDGDNILYDVRTIIAYNGTTKIATIDENWLDPTTPTYEVRHYMKLVGSSWKWISNIADAVTAVFDPSTASPWWELDNATIDGFIVDDMGSTDRTANPVIKFDSAGCRIARRMTVNVSNVNHSGEALTDARLFLFSGTNAVVLKGVRSPGVGHWANATFGPLIVEDSQFGNKDQYTENIFGVRGNSTYLEGECRFKNVVYYTQDEHIFKNTATDANQRIICDGFKVIWKAGLGAKHFHTSTDPNGVDNYVCEGAGIILSANGDTNYFLGNGADRRLMLSSMGRGVLGYGIENYHDVNSNVAVSGYGSGTDTDTHPIPDAGTDKFPNIPGSAGMRILNLDRGNAYHRSGWIHDGTEWLEYGGVGFKGPDAVSADEVTLVGAGTYFDITGTTTINHIANTNWQAGAMITLQFDAPLIVTHNSATPTGTEASLLLSGSTNFTPAAGDTLTLVYDGTTFREISRTVI